MTRAPPATTAKLATLEALRGAAALLVLGDHALTSAAAEPSLGLTLPPGTGLPGNVGVEFFFVLSGFVMVMLHARDMGRATRVPAFLWRRACRIYPLFWIVGAFFVWRLRGWPALTAPNLLNWFSLAPVAPPAVLPNLVIVAWTLRQEVAFYLMFALAMLPGMARPVLLLWVAGLVLGPTREAWDWAGPFADTFGYAFAPFAWEFLAGMLAAFAFARLRLSRAQAAALVAAGVALACWRLAVDGPRYGPLDARLAYALAFGSIILGLATLERADVLRPGRWALALGALSYPLYLTHIVAIDRVLAWAVAPGWLGRGDGAIAVALFVVTGVLLAAAVARWIDRPIQRALRARPTSAPSRLAWRAGEASDAAPEHAR